MFKLTICIVLTLMSLINMAISENAADDAYIENMYMFSIAQAESLSEQWRNDNFIEEDLYHRSNLIMNFVESETIDCPNLFWQIEPTEHFDIEKEIERNELTPQMAMGEWLRIPSTVNASDAVYDLNYVLWVDWFSLYSTYPKEENMPEMMYTVLVYEDETPQIVTSFYAVSDTVYLTKTSFIYSDLILPQSKYATFPYQLSLWFEQLKYRLFDTAENKFKMIKDVIL